MPSGWPKPSWGQWQLRDVDVIDVRRVPSEQNGYCFGSRIIYEDSQTHYALWEDVFDANLKFWKPSLEAQREVKDPVVGFVPGPVTSMVWDVQNNHMTQSLPRTRRVMICSRTAKRPLLIRISLNTPRPEDYCRS